MSCLHQSVNPADFLAPRWSWHSVLLAAALSAGIFLLLPFLESLSVPPERDLNLRKVDTAILPPPPPPLKMRQVEKRTEPPKPKLKTPRKRLVPLQAAMNLTMAMGDVGGDFQVDFGLSADVLGEQMESMVFELSELDEPPRPLARLQPMYPPQARMRQLQGMVELEFVVAPDGTTREIIVTSSHPGNVFTDAAIRAIQRWRFSPGTKGGKAVAARVRQKVEFKLN